MNTPSKSSHMNLIPVLLLVALILGAGYLLLKGEIKFPSFDNEPQVRRVNGFPTVVYTTDVIDKQRAVITNEEELSKFLNTVDKTGILQVNEKINFEKEMVLAVSTKSLEQTGTDVKIRKIYQDTKNKTLQVSIKQSTKDSDCDLTDDPNIPVDLVVIDKTDWKVSFDVLKETISCKTTDEQDQESSSSN